MMRLATLYQFNQSPEYKKALKVHYKSQQDEDNALFEAMHQLVTNKPSKALQLLQDFPTLTTDHPITHKTQWYSWVKNGWKKQTKTPKPYYARSSKINEWKKNPYKADQQGTSIQTMPGLDFLVAYNLALIQPKPITKPTALVVEDRKTQRDKIVLHLKSKAYHTLQAGWLKEAKELAPKADMILTDYDLKKLGGYQAQNDGMQFLRWLREQIDNNLLAPNEVIMHSTLFDDRDIPSKLFGKSIRREVEELGFKHRPKKVILSKDDY